MPVIRKIQLFSALLILATLSWSAELHAKDEAGQAAKSRIGERITIFGAKDKREKFPGSASIVSEKTLERYQYTDIHRALKEVPGVTVQEEDGHGLRPNIAIRGGRSNRSADITLMEDGILTGPAPYAAPEAYYFPQMDRMQSLEVIKGTGSVKYGPRTTNGVLNMVTKPIPSTKQAALVAEAGSHETYRTGITAGGSSDGVGFMLNAFHKESGGFKEIDYVGGDTGYNVQDVMGKLRFQTPASQSIYQEVELKLGYYDELSDETYLGLTDSDFSANRNRRYGSSQLDEMDARAWQAAATHFIELAPGRNLTTTIYHNEFDRSWYRLSGLTINGVRRDIGAIFNDQTANAAYVDALKAADGAGASYIQRNNARTYYAEGVQSVFGADFRIGETVNKLETGVRFHQDEEDRFQREDTFSMTGGNAVIGTVGVNGAAGNRIQSAKAWSGFVQNEINWNKWRVTPGVRFEHIELKREDFGSSDPNRTGSSLAVFENDLNVWIPGVGVAYDVTSVWKILGSVHKGFAPPGVPGNANEAAFTSEEKSINMELGTRYTQGPWSAELFGFLTDYENLLGRDTFSSGGGGTGDTYNGGEVEVKGIEATLQYDAAKVVKLPEGYRLPLAASYTLTQGEFKNSFVSSFEEWGTVTAGDELPYLPENQLYLSAGLETDVWAVSFSGKHVDEMRTRAGNGSIPENRKVDAHWTFDVAGEYKFGKNVAGFVTVENLFDEEYIAARRPAGVRPGLPLTAMAGVKLSLW